MFRPMIWLSMRDIEAFYWHPKQQTVTYILGTANSIHDTYMNSGKDKATHGMWYMHVILLQQHEYVMGNEVEKQMKNIFLTW